MIDHLLSTLEKRLGRYAVRNLMSILMIGMAGVYVLDVMTAASTGFSLIAFLSFSRSAILRGEIWRLFSFVFVPQGGGLILQIVTMYFYWMIGSMLENRWGSFRFNVFYITGVIGAAAGGMITGYASAYYLNMSLLIAFTLLYPDYEVLLFFVLPVRMKWLGILAGAGLLLSFITGTWAIRLTLLMAMINLALFFGKDVIGLIRQMNRRREWKKQWRS